MNTCYFCNYNRSDTQERPVRFEGRDGDEDSVVPAPMCDSCATRNTDEAGIIWAIPCDECGRRACAGHSYVQTYAATWSQPVEGMMVCSACAGPDRYDY